jgi:ribonuclease-3
MEIDFDKLEERLGHRFADRGLAGRALTHPSFEHERSGAGEGDYQRLEFLGDAVLGMVLAEVLYRRFPDRSEGDLSRIRAGLADQDSLAAIARTAGLGTFIRLGRGEELSAGREKDSILSDVLEALIGAVHLDGGLTAARDLIERLFGDSLERPVAALKINDAKSELQELLSARQLPAPDYRLVEESGPPHCRLFRFQVLLGESVAGEGIGRSKKTAQQAAAVQALEKLLAPDNGPA